MNREEQPNIVKEVHEGLGTSEKAAALASHLGINAVRKQISLRYFLAFNCEGYHKQINQSSRCQKTFNRNLKVSLALKPVKMEQQVMKQVGVDLIQVPESNGFKFVIVLIDYFSKWTEIKPLSNKTAVSVAPILYKVICRHGYFKIQINNQGREFVKSVSIALRDMIGTQQHVTSAYHLQANALEMKRGIEEKAMNSIVCLQKKQKNDYDRKHATASKDCVGQKVLLRNLLRNDRKGAKMNFSWLGPYAY
ncbi:uncharacterized protein LOC136082086 [Hydra vulgaris]|uniref:Uncharacterized protein LOC136082086 n=1 Tax=Hydra vulgaris TaxID=6087 RepID=A0ABM4C587_HYDVU